MKSRPLLRVSKKGVKRIVDNENTLNKLERSDIWHSEEPMHGKTHFGPLHNEKEPKKYAYNFPKKGLPKDKKHDPKPKKAAKRSSAKGKGKTEKSISKAMHHADKPGAGAKKRKHLKGKAKVEVVMKEFKRGTLRSGGSGKHVTNPKQAIAIALSEARKSGAKIKKKK